MNRRMRKARSAVLHKQGRSRYRALQKLGQGQGELAMYDAWLMTNPTPEHVEAVLNARLLRTPMRNIPTPAREVRV